METTKVDSSSLVTPIESGCKSLSLDKITVDSDLQVRVSLNEETIAKYAQEMQDGEEFPPIDVFFDGKKYWLANGFHRLEATKKIGRKEIVAKIHSGKKKDAILFAVNADKAVGLSRTNQDKHRAVEMLLSHDDCKKWSALELARHAGVSDRFVSKVKKNLSPNGSEIPEKTKVIRNGKEYEMNTALIGKNGTDANKDLMTSLASVLAADYDQESAKASGLAKQESLIGQPPTSVPKAEPTIAEIKAPSRAIGKVEKLANDLMDELNLYISEAKKTNPDRQAVDSIADLNGVVKGFLAKFDGEE